MTEIDETRNHIEIYLSKKQKNHIEMPDICRQLALDPFAQRELTKEKIIQSPVIYIVTF